MRFHRIISFLVVFIWMINLVSISASASGVDDDWNWSDSVNDYVFVPFSDLVSDAIISIDNVIDTVTDVMGQNAKDIFDFWAGFFCR